MLNLLLKTTLKYLRKATHKEFYLFWLCIIAQVSIYFASFDFKVSIAVSTVLIGCFYLLTRNLLLSIFFCLLFSTRYELFLGKYYRFEAVSASEYEYEQAPLGIIFTYGVALTDVLTSTFLLLSLRNFLHGQRSILKLLPTLTSFPTFKFIVFCLVASFALVVYGSAYYSYYPLYSLVNSLVWIKLLVIFVSTYLFMNSKKKYLSAFTYFFAAVLLFEGGLPLKNFVLNSNATSNSNLSYVIPENQIAIPRLDSALPIVGNYNQHAFSISVFLICYFAVLLRMSKTEIKKFRTLSLLVSSLSFVNVILTQSRIMWIAWFIVLAIIIFNSRKELLSLLARSRINKFKKQFLILLFFAIFLTLSVIVPRIYLSQYAFSEDGSGTIRITMLVQGVKMIILSPYFGFGLGTSVRAILNNLSNSYIESFPFSVHLAYIHLAMEVGIPAAALFFLPFFFLFRKLSLELINKRTQRNVVLFAGIFFIILQYFFQPFCISHEYLLLALVPGCIL